MTPANELTRMMDLKTAQKIAGWLLADMEPHCERLQVAGSIRRQKPDGIKDVEIVAIPRWGYEESHDLFNEPIRVNRLWQWAVANQNRATWIKPGTSEIIPWRPKPDGKYWRGIIAAELKLDLFLAESENYGLILLIRTGPADFSQAVVTQALRIGKKVKDGHLHDSNGFRIPCPDEESVFAALGLEFVPPEERVGFDSLKGARA